MLKLSIAIRMRRAFQSLGVCLQAIAQLVQQLGYQTVADAVTTTAQFLGQFAHALASPAQRRLRVTTAQRLDQPLQIPHQRRVLAQRSEEHTSELQSRQYLVCRLLLEKKKIKT